MDWATLPDWLSLLMLFALALITWWYARSTHEMARTMKETYEMQLVPQLVIHIGEFEQHGVGPTWQKLSFALTLINAGNYLLTVERVLLVQEVPYTRVGQVEVTDRVETLVTTNPTLPWDLIPSPELKRVFQCETTFVKNARHLRIRVQYKDLRGRSYSRDYPLPLLPTVQDRKAL